MMKFRILAVLALVGFSAVSQVDADKAAVIKSIYTEALGEQQGYQWLKYMCEVIGPRPSGSEAANEAARWAKVAMLQAGADTAWLQEVEVPKWYRGPEWSKAYAGGERLFHCRLRPWVDRCRPLKKAFALRWLRLDPSRN